MRLTFAKLLSILIVSDNGSKVNGAVASLRDFCFDRDQETQLTKTYLIQHGVLNNRAAFYRVGSELHDLLTPHLRGIPLHFCGRDGSVQPPSN